MRFGISNDTINAILDDYALPVFGFHGVSHWARVYENGTRLAELTGADLQVVQLFAVFHDSRRVNEGWDDGHGLRGAEFAYQQRGTLFDLSEHAFEQLYFACAHHTDGETDADVTIQTCWDSDRLDLGRVGIVPDPEKLCTAAAKSREILHWAESRSRPKVVPEFVRTDWGVAFCQLQSQWEIENCRVESGIFFEDGDVVLLEGNAKIGYRPLQRLRLAELIASDPGGWCEIHESFGCRVEVGDSVVTAGGGEKCEEGFIACAGRAGHRLKWILHLNDIGAFTSLEIRNGVVCATAKIGRRNRVVRIPIDDPLGVEISA